MDKSLRGSAAIVGPAPNGCREAPGLTPIELLARPAPLAGAVPVITATGLAARTESGMSSKK